eukprot:TRINITY_DN11997_c0_g1_i3.p1 TRINITY_DN11997_c0_g1~~TRINITY_DN11997_c0_g1_i3.p1  ORF type:complete len:179 (+),score=0.90 TRINITY_DN11997_c0_g1_i3:42-578(+)
MALPVKSPYRHGHVRYIVSMAMKGYLSTTSCINPISSSKFPSHTSLNLNDYPVGSVYKLFENAVAPSIQPSSTPKTTVQKPTNLPSVRLTVRMQFQPTFVLNTRLKLHDQYNQYTRCPVHEYRHGKYYKPLVFNSDSQCDYVRGKGNTHGTGTETLREYERNKRGLIGYVANTQGSIL